MLLRPLSIANVARLFANYKGQDILMEVLGSSVWRGRDWRLRLYGDGPDKRYLKSLAQHYEIAERVEFCGHVSDIRSIGSESAFGTSVLRPGDAVGAGGGDVVRSAGRRDGCGGNAEWIDDGETGFVAEAPTASSFGAALERAWLANAQWQKMGSKGREKALLRFDKSAGKSLLNVVLDATRSSRLNPATDLNPYERGS